MKIKTGNRYYAVRDGLALFVPDEAHRKSSRIVLCYDGDIVAFKPETAEEPGEIELRQGAPIVAPAAYDETACQPVLTVIKKHGLTRTAAQSSYELHADLRALLLRYRCCEAATNWIVERPPKDEHWYVTCLCDDPEHWRPNSDVRQAQDQQEAEALCRRLNNPEKQVLELLRTFIRADGELDYQLERIDLQSATRTVYRVPYHPGGLQFADDSGELRVRLLAVPTGNAGVSTVEEITYDSRTTQVGSVDDFSLLVYTFDPYGRIWYVDKIEQCDPCWLEYRIGSHERWERYVEPCNSYDYLHGFVRGKVGRGSGLDWRVCQYDVYGRKVVRVAIGFNGREIETEQVAEVT